MKNRHMALSDDQYALPVYWVKYIKYCYTETLYMNILKNDTYCCWKVDVKLVILVVQFDCLLKVPFVHSLSKVQEMESSSAV